MSQSPLQFIALPQAVHTACVRSKRDVEPSFEGCNGEEWIISVEIISMGVM